MAQPNHTPGKRTLRCVCSILLTLTLIICTAIAAKPMQSEVISAYGHYGVKDLIARAGEPIPDESSSDAFAEDRVIVRLRSGFALQSNDLSDLYGLEVDSMDLLMSLSSSSGKAARGASLPDSICVMTLKRKGPEAVNEAIALLEQNANVVYAEPDYLVRSAAVAPNDPMFDTYSMWGMKKIHAPAAWEFSTDGGEVVVAVIDSGIDHTHPRPERKYLA